MLIDPKTVAQVKKNPVLRNLCEQGIFPVAIGVDTLTLSVGSGHTPETLQDLAFSTGKRITQIDLPTAARTKLRSAYTSDHTASNRERNEESPETGPSLPSLGHGRVVEQVNRILTQAASMQASDIHIEPYEHDFRVRFRLDGVLHTLGSLGLPQREALLSRIKIMAGLDIAEKRRPQDGRLSFRTEGRTIDLRVSTLPTRFGEKAVLRLLDRQQVALDLNTLGFRADELARLQSAIRLSYGMILVTGPTGSGKTTTLYAALNALNQDAVNITTIEDPVEYDLPGINQTQVRAELGLTFAHALRSFLRQDPDVIMVGEIRDQETAAIAIRAALTGHLVLSTLHTNDAASTMTRLIDMGVEPFLVAASVRLILAQRLVRKVCPACAATVTTGAEMKALLPDLPETHRQGQGCPQCNGTGYRGRTALFEALPVSDRLAEMVGQRASHQALRHQAFQEGMRSLRQAALAQVAAGLTTPEEVLRETTL